LQICDKSTPVEHPRRGGLTVARPDFPSVVKVFDSLAPLATARAVSKTDLSDEMARLQHLSDARAQQVLSLIQDLAELEAMENATDLKAARDALGEAEEPLPWDQVKARLDAQFDSPQPAS
jgi:hypothetical protein